MLKVFISHKREDSAVASDVLSILKKNDVEAYLDLLDYPNELKGQELTDHIKGRLNSCTDLLVVISERTKESWWVPFEIGMASQKDFPIVNYLKRGILLPDYLSYWPRLKDENDLTKYIRISNKVNKEIILEKAMGKVEFATPESATKRFYRELKAAL